MATVTQDVGSDNLASGHCPVFEAGDIERNTLLAEDPSSPAFCFAHERSELAAMQAEYNQKVVLQITTHVLGFSSGSLTNSLDIRGHMDLHKAAEISRLSKGAVKVHDAVSLAANLHNAASAF